MQPRIPLELRQLRCALVWALAGLAADHARAQSPTDAMTREYTVYNDLVNPVFPTDAITREYTIFNDLVNPVPVTDAVSRECTVFKFQQLLTSSLPAHAYPVAGLLPDQLSMLSAGPPPFNESTWQGVSRKNTDSSSLFVCTEVPEPLLENFVNASQYSPEADEVTLDNCGSAFYRFTFTLPSGAASVRLRGFANCDDQAVAFLNGQQISGTMTIPPCIPSGNPGDPCYGAQNVGHDLTDSMGRPILTSPTPDPFETSTQEFFQVGLNELVFAVCGDAAYYDPTGVEFAVMLEYDFANVGCNITVSQDPIDVEVCPGASGRLTVQASSGGVLTYQWRRDGLDFVDGGSISGAQSAMLLIDPVQAADAGSYDVVIRTECDEETSSPAILILRTPVAISEHPDDLVIVPGNPASFEVVATGDPAITYQWRRKGVDLADGEAVSGAMTPTLVIDPAGMSDAGSYDVVVTNACGSVTSEDAQLTVLGHQLTRSVMADGCVESNSSTYAMRATMGQPVAGIATGPNHVIHAGFWVRPAGAPAVCGCGDLDSDGDVDAVDFSTFSVCFGLMAPSVDCPAGSFFCADLNGSGGVDLVDFSLFSAAFGLAATGSPPDCE